VAAAPAPAPPALPGASAARRAAPSRRVRRSRRAALAFVAPMAVALAAVAGWPLVRTIALAFTDANLADLDQRAFVGLENFVDLARDPDWWRAVWNTLRFAAISVALETVLGVGIALVLDAHLPGRGLLRAAVLVPWAIPTVVSAQMWSWMLNDLHGVVNAILLASGIIDAPRAFTAEPGLALAAVIAVDVWKTTPFVALLALAALQLVPAEVRDAARLDGVSAWTMFWRVTLPLIRPALVVAVVFRTLDALRIFDLPYVLAGGGRDTATMAIYAREQLVEFQDVGYGSAASTALFLVVAAVTAVAIGAGRLRPEGR
jgi:trehalose/maltose transport system permease protein